MEVLSRIAEEAGKSRGKKVKVHTTDMDEIIEA